MSLGTDLLPSSVAGVLTAFIPMATVAAARFAVPGEHFSIRRVPGLLLATAGVILLVVAARGDDGARISLLGVVLFLTGVFLAGVGGALNRRFAMGTPATASATSSRCWPPCWRSASWATPPRTRCCSAVA